MATLDYEISCKFLKQRDVLGDLFKCMDTSSLARFSICSKEIHTFFLDSIRTDIEKWTELLKANDQKTLLRQSPRLQNSTPMMSLLCSRWQMMKDKVWIFHGSISSLDYFYLFYLKAKSSNLEFRGKGYFPAQNGFSILKPSLTAQASESNPLFFVGSIDWKGAGFSFLELHVKFLNNSEFVLEGDFWQTSYRPTQPRDGTIIGEVYGTPFKSDQHHRHHLHHHHDHHHHHDSHTHDSHTHDSKDGEHDHTHSDFHNFPSYEELRRWKEAKLAKEKEKKMNDVPLRRSCLIQ